MQTQYDGPDYSAEKTEVKLLPNVRYPSGRAILSDDFEGASIGWKISVLVNDTITLSTVYPFEGIACLKGLVVAPYGSGSSVWKRLPLVESKKMGIECAWRLETGSGSFFVELQWHKLPTTNYEGAIKYNSNTGKLYYYTTGPVYTELTGAPQTLLTNNYAWHTMKMLCDFNTGKYIGLHINDVFLDMSTLPMYSTAVAAQDWSYAQLGYLWQTDADVEWEADAVVVTEE